MRIAILDRDGVLNEDLPEGVRSPGDLRILPGAAEAVARLNRAGVPVILATNQSAIGRGTMAAAMLERIHDRLREELALTQARLDLILVAPDAPERAGPRRKPAPGMIEEALACFHVLPAEAPVIGDALSDLQAAAAAGCPRLLVRTGKGAATQAAGIPGAVLPVAVYDDLAAAVTALLGGRG